MVLSDKVIKSINKYLSISNKYNISIGIIIGDNSDTITISNGDKSKEGLFYDIGSISKTFTAHMILKCVNEGLINLDDKLDKYLKLKEKEYPTIRELLSHSCGFNHITPIEIVVPALLSRRYSKRNIYENITNETMARATGVGGIGLSGLGLTGFLSSRIINKKRREEIKDLKMEYETCVCNETEEDILKR